MKRYTDPHYVQYTWRYPMNLPEEFFEVGMSRTNRREAYHTLGLEQLINLNRLEAETLELSRLLEQLRAYYNNV